MTKSCIWTLSLASAVAMTLVPALAPAMAQTRPDGPTAPAPFSRSSALAIAPRQIAAPAPAAEAGAPLPATTRAAGSRQGFGPLQANPQLATQPLQSGGGTW
jgi:hypothetical protein